MLKTVLIGLGRIGWNFHLPEILKHNKAFSLCAAADVDQERLAELSEKYGAVGYTDYRKMLEIEKPDVVVIASPTIFHKEQAIESMRAGADVILDKPMAADLESAREIAEAAVTYNRKITVYQPHLFFAIATVAKRIIDSGVLGEVFQIRRCCSGYVRRNDWQAIKKYGGGMLNNYGAHYIDQLLFLSGERVEKLFCQLHCIATVGDADDVARIVMQTEKGTILDVDINQAAALDSEPLMIFGKYGATKVQVNSEGKEEFLVRYYDPKEVPERTLVTELAARGRRYPSEQLPWKEEIYPVLPKDRVDYYEKCALYFNGQEEAPVPLRDTLRVMELIDSCRRSAEQKS